MVSRRTLVPASGPLTPLTKLVGSRRFRATPKNYPRETARCRVMRRKDGCGGGVLDGRGTVVSGSNATESCDRSVDDHSNSTEAASVILSPTSDDRIDDLCRQGVAGRLITSGRAYDHLIQRISLQRFSIRLSDLIYDACHELVAAIISVRIALRPGISHG